MKSDGVHSARDVTFCWETCILELITYTETAVYYKVPPVNPSN
jgi:hypothetical protein